MKGRITAYLVLLACGFGVLAFTSGGVNWARDKLAYAGLIAQRGNEDDPSRAAAILRYDRSDHLVPARSIDGQRSRLASNWSLRSPPSPRLATHGPANGAL